MLAKNLDEVISHISIMVPTLNLETVFSGREHPPQRHKDSKACQKYMLKTMDHGKGEDGNSGAEVGFFFFSFLINFHWNRVALKVKVKVARLCPTLRDPVDWSMEFSRPEYWSG